MKVTEQTPGARFLKITLDGEIVGAVKEADSEEGYVLKYVAKEDGTFEEEPQRVDGTVVITVQPLEEWAERPSCGTCDSDAMVVRLQRPEPIELYWWCMNCEQEALT